MKKQIAKVKTFVTKHERDIDRVTWYVIGAAVGIFAADVGRKVSYNQFAARHPEHDIVVKDKQGYFYGLDNIDKKE